MFYEIEMLPEYIQSIMNMLNEVDNPENVTIDICFNTQEYLETIDIEMITTVGLHDKFHTILKPLRDLKVKMNIIYKNTDDRFYNIAQYRRELNYNYCEYVDYVLWGETDSMFPRECLDVIETISSYANMNEMYKFILSFAYRVNWDKSWDILTHVKFENIDFIDNPEWTMNDEASSKSYMTIDRMDEINSDADELDIRIIKYPKFDGSCLVISSELIKAGALIPHALTHCAEDTSFGEISKLIMGDEYTQFVIKNVLRVHNRRHPRKRLYIKGEDNPHGLAGISKGPWWDILEKTSKHNLSILRNNKQKFISLDEVIFMINESRKYNGNEK